MDDGTWNLFLFHCSFPLNLKQAKLESSSTTAVGGYSNGAAAAKKQQSTSTAVAPSAVLTEPPEYLRRLLLTLVKTFYGLECFVVFEYIMKRVILKEEELRDVCKIDQRQLRKFLVTLKVDKFIKERLVPGEVDGRVRKFTYYFVNYKGALNVTKYKVDHIRQKLEVREKDDVHRAYYRCVNDLCRRQYDAMDMGKIFDPFTQEMRCWQCKNVVEQDVSGGPSQVTRSSIANFNEQMTAIFSLLKQLDGVRFGREIMEPAIQASIPRMEGETIELERKVINLGQRAFSTAGKSRSDLYGGEITVSIGDDSLEKAPQAKAEIPWLLASRQNLADEQLQSASTAQSLQSLTVETTETDGSITFEHSQSVVAANSATAFPQKEEASVEEPLPKRQRRDEIASLLADEVRESESVVEANEEDREEEEEEGNLEQRSERIEKQDEEEDTEAKEADPGDFVLVQGERVHIDDIDEQKLAQMSEREKTDYYERMQGAYEDFY